MNELNVIDSLLLASVISALVFILVFDPHPLDMGWTWGLVSWAKNVARVMECHFSNSHKTITLVC